MMSLSLFDLPNLIRAALDALREEGIGRVEPLAVFFPKEDDGLTMVIQIRYFKALGQLQGCDTVRRYQDNSGEYQRLLYQVRPGLMLVFDKPISLF
jgi:hypothetical protein